MRYTIISRNGTALLLNQYLQIDWEGGLVVPSIHWGTKYGSLLVDLPVSNLERGGI